MPRKPKTPTVPDNIHVDARDVVANVFPDGVPKELDGTVNTNAEISIKQVQEIGALDEDAAAANKATARIVQKKQQGATNVAWPTSDPMEQFDLLKMTWPGKTFAINILQVEPVLTNYRPVMTSNFKTRTDLYDYISKHIHKQSEARRYEIKYCDTLGQVRAKGFLNMPDTRDQPQENEMSRQNPFPFPPPYGYPGYPPPGYPPPGYPPPQNYPPQGYGAPNYPPTGYGAPPPPAPPQAPPPAPAPVPQAAPAAPPPQMFVPPEPPSQQVASYSYPGQPVLYANQGAFANQGAAPGVYEALQASQSAFAENRRTQDTLQQVLLQNAQLLGQMEAMRQQQQMATMYPPPPPPPQVANPPGPPSQAGQAPAPTGFAGPPAYPPGYPIPPGYPPPSWNSAPPGWPPPPPYPGMYPPGYPQPAWPQQPYPSPPAQAGQPTGIPVPNDPAAAAQGAVNTIASLVHAVQAVQRIPGFGGGRGPFAQQDDGGGDDGAMDAGPQAPEMPWTMMPIVGGEKPIMMAVGKDGHTNWPISAMASAPGILNSAKELVESIAKLQRGQEQLSYQQQQILARAGQGGAPQHQALPQQIPQEPAQSQEAPSLAEMAAASRGVNGIS